MKTQIMIFLTLLYSGITIAGNEIGIGGGGRTSVGENGGLGGNVKVAGENSGYGGSSGGGGFRPCGDGSGGVHFIGEGGISGGPGFNNKNP